MGIGSNFVKDFRSWKYCDEINDTKFIHRNCAFDVFCDTCSKYKPNPKNQMHDRCDISDISRATISYYNDTVIIQLYHRLSKSYKLKNTFNINNDTLLISDVFYKNILKMNRYVKFLRYYMVSDMFVIADLNYMKDKDKLIYYEKTNYYIKFISKMIFDINEHEYLNIIKYQFRSVLRIFDCVIPDELFDWHLFIIILDLV